MNESHLETMLLLKYGSKREAIIVWWGKTRESMLPGEWDVIEQWQTDAENLRKALAKELRHASY